MSVDIIMARLPVALLLTLIGIMLGVGIVGCVAKIAAGRF